MNTKLIFLLFSSFLLLAFSKPVQAESCYDSEKPPIPGSLKFRDVILKEHQIKIKIPENYRFLKWNKNRYNIVDESAYNFIQCFLRKPEPTELDPRGVEFEIVTNLEDFYNLIKESDVKIFESNIKNYRALIWKSQRMYNIRYIAIQSPDQRKFVIFSTMLDENDQTPLEGLIAILTETLVFL